MFKFRNLFALLFFVSFSMALKPMQADAGLECAVVNSADAGANDKEDKKLKESFFYRLSCKAFDKALSGVKYSAPFFILGTYVCFRYPDLKDNAIDIVTDFIHAKHWYTKRALLNAVWNDFVPSGKGPIPYISAALYYAYIKAWNNIEAAIRHKKTS